MSETTTPHADAAAPRSDLMSSMGKEVSVFLRKSEDFAALRLPFEEDQSLKARLVGFDRQGIWIEPTRVREEALSRQAAVPHFFVAWESVLSVARYLEAESFNTKKEYRGLRPQG